MGIPTEPPSADSAESFDAFVAVRWESLVRSATLILRDWDEARDAVQDALISVWPRWDSLGPAPDAYVYRSVVNACLLRLRQKRRVQPVAEPALLARTAATTDATSAWLLEDEAWRLSAQLPPTQRAAVVLRFHADLTFADIGEALGCPEGTARSHVHRALRRLRARYEEGL